MPPPAFAYMFGLLWDYCTKELWTVFSIFTAAMAVIDLVAFWTDATFRTDSRLHQYDYQLSRLQPLLCIFSKSPAWPISGCSLSSSESSIPCSAEIGPCSRRRSRMLSSNIRHEVMNVPRSKRSTSVSSVIRHLDLALPSTDRVFIEIDVISVSKTSIDQSSVEKWW